MTYLNKADSTLVNIGLNITGRTSDVTGISSPIVILHSVCCRSRRQKYNESRRERQSQCCFGSYEEERSLFTHDWLTLA